MILKMHAPIGLVDHHHTPWRTTHARRFTFVGTREELGYLIIACRVREVMRVTVNGDRARIKCREFIGTHMNHAVSPREFTIERKSGVEAEGEWIRVFPHSGRALACPCHWPRARVASRTRYGAARFFARCTTNESVERFRPQRAMRGIDYQRRRRAGIDPAESSDQSS